MAGNQRKKLNRDMVVDAAYSYVEENDTTLSLRGLAKQMGISPMALYNYFDTKDALVRAIVDRFVYEVDIHEVPGEHWDETQRRFTRGILQAVRDNVKLAALTLTIFPLEPSLIEFSSYIHKIFQRQGMPEEHYRLLRSSCDTFITGYAQHYTHVALCNENEQGCDLVKSWRGTIARKEEGDCPEDTIDILIEGLRAKFGSNEKNYVTPNTPWPFEEDLTN